ncbi:MAG: DUF362 domain-containing protein [Bacteroidia bacterium]|nr:DUF362 domain-containing protein [Bacteroidia bacterium]
MLNRIRQTVAIVKTNEMDYEKIDVQQMVDDALVLLEKEGVVLPSKGSVFIKPNLLLSASAKDGITTEPKIVTALIKNLSKRGVETIYVGDSSAGFAKIEDALEYTGMLQAVLENGAILVDIDDPKERIDVELPNSDIVKTISVPKKLLEVDYIINCPKLKTHRFGAMTAAVKNWVGLTEKSERLRLHQNRLPKLVAELHNLIKEDLVITDALVIGEGDGPDLCKGRYLGVLMASTDPVANDSIGSELLGIDRNELIFPWTAYLDGIGEINRNLINVVGSSIKDVSIEVERPVEVMYNRFPCNFIFGGYCPGCFVWLIGPALFWQKEGLWDSISTVKGRPTIMLGFNAEDVNFERHLEEGPYFVIGDCAPEKYRNHPDTVYIPGCTPGPKISETILGHLGLSLDIWGTEDER